MRHKCMKWFSTFSQHKRNFNNISFLHNFAHNHADMIMCIDNDYLLIFSMLFFESANVIDAVCIFLRKISQKYALYELNFVPLYSKTVMKNN